MDKMEIRSDIRMQTAIHDAPGILTKQVMYKQRISRPIPRPRLEIRIRNRDSYLGLGIRI